MNDPSWARDGKDATKGEWTVGQDAILHSPVWKIENLLHESAFEFAAASCNATFLPIVVNLLFRLAYQIMKCFFQSCVIASSLPECSSPLSMGLIIICCV